jgi:hypothetical protein
MRLVKFKLADSPFWFLGKVSLSQQNKSTELIDIDSFSDQDKKAIENSIRQFQIKVFDFEGNRIKTIKDIGYINGELNVNLEDINKNEQDLMPEIVSITIDDNEEDDEEEIFPEDPTPEDLENAKILLSKNGNTVKKAIKQMNNLLMLYACLTVENVGKNRNGIIDLLGKKIKELTNA